MAKTARLAKIEGTANVCIAVAAVLLLVTFSWRFSGCNPPSRSQRTPIPQGAMIKLPDFDWSGSPQTLLLALSTDCAYCTFSTSFYRRLVKQAEVTRNTRLIAVLPQAIHESREYFAKHDLRIDSLRQAVPASFGVNGTPTLILVDSSGVVIQSWGGMVPPEVETEILAFIE